jgi:hypothetical protein
VSKRGDAKKSRRKKRLTANSRVLPAAIVDQLAAIPDGVVADLAEFDERITARGWTFDEDESNDDYAVWFYEPSGAEVDDGLPVTSLWLDAAEDGELVHLVFVGTTAQHTFAHSAFTGHLDTIEAYRAGEPLPLF